MHRAQVSTSFVRFFVLVTLVLLPFSIAAGSARSGLISPKQPVPDDPLAGLPTDSGGQGRGKGGPSGSNKAACAIKANPANDRNIGDLRATLAFVKHGPKSFTCPAHAAQAEIRLRISIDGAGKITACEPISGDASASNALAKALAGKSVGPRSEGATVGTVVLAFASGRS